jgi:hypothetical protein
MRKINYNLAGTRKIDRRAFALNLGVLLLALVLLNAATISNLARLQSQSRAEKKEIGSLAKKMSVMNQRTVQRQDKIAVLQKTWNQQLAFANSLIMRKCFSFVARLNFLERICGDGIIVRQLGIANEAEGRITMAVNALSQKELIVLYKKLLPYKLGIASETQSVENYQANLSFRMEDEKK